jgi:S-DNA-T family DNA segregation ATPase FtsK/SpoIIIE
MSRRARATRRRSPFKFKLKKKSVQAILSVVCLSVSVLFFLSYFLEGEVTTSIREALFTSFGFGALLFPLVLLLLGLMLSRIKVKFLQANLLVGLALILISFITLLAPLSAEAGGTVGLTIWQNLADIIGGPISFMVFFVALTVGLIIFFNTPIEEVFTAIGKAVSFLGMSVANIFDRHASEGEAFAKDKQKIDIRVAQEPVAAKTGMVKDPVPALGTQILSNSPNTNQVWNYPPLTLLSDAGGQKAARGDLKQNAGLIEKTLEDFGIQAKVLEVNSGPSVTQYAIQIASGTKLTKITGLANDIALALAAPTGTVRIEAPIPGKSLVGIEVPNLSPETVMLKSLLSSQVMQKNKSKLALALGLDVSGEPMIGDLARMPHVLVAGSTGSGKSVAINGFISNLLFRTTPTEVKLILVDPKIVELSQWNGIPHLLTPVITEPEKVLSALRWAVGEMERRYKSFAEVGARNIDSYNEMSGFQALPYIVIILDELADLMMFAPVEIEDAIVRLAQMARAVGIHLVLATQRPSVDVITGLIKANIPSRIAFNVVSQIDSRVIIDVPGAEKLLGKGDMLYVPPDASKPFRIQGVYVSDNEINKLIDFLKKTGVEPQYTEEIVTMPISKIAKGMGAGLSGDADGRDDLFEEAVKVVVQYDRASASLLQRRLKVGYARAARLLDELESAGVVGIADGSKPRDVLVRDAGRALGGEVPADRLEE